MTARLTATLNATLGRHVSHCVLTPTVIFTRWKDQRAVELTLAWLIGGVSIKITRTRRRRETR